MHAEFQIQVGLLPIVWSETPVNSWG